MKLRTQLALAFLGCGLLPLFLSGTINFRSASNGMQKLESDASRALASSAEAQLTAIRGLKKQQIQTYFDIIQKLVVNWSESPSTVGAMKKLQAGFREFKNESDVDDISQSPRGIDGVLLDWFFREYKKQNEGKNSNIAEFVGGQRYSRPGTDCLHQGKLKPAWIQASSGPRDQVDKIQHRPRRNTPDGPELFGTIYSVRRVSDRFRNRRSDLYRLQGD